MARDVVLVNGLPGSGKSSLAPRLAAALGAGFLSKDRVKEALADAVVTDLPTLGAVAMDTVWRCAADLPGMVVVDSWWFRPRDLEHARTGLARAGASGSVEVWCDVPADLARARFVARRRPDVHADAERLATRWSGWAARAEPLRLGPVIRVDTARPVDVGAVADRVRAALWA
ncbi:AAA family ATPase [Jidongwangia harbinensis]|uniref:AAA family ATPase n=1 Tax=Jidongwangia harbinensis TaxID=2878561 RepID=UPI002342D24D|nr:AAA family ATPase [Jidongwangia harbinensis]